MSIYVGKFSWQRWSTDDLMVVVLPQGTPVRNNDPIFLFSFWGLPHEGFDDQNNPRLRSVSQVTNTGDEDHFVVSDGYFFQEGVASDSYKKIAMTMVNPENHREVADLDLHYQVGSNQQANDREVLVWTGKANWSTNMTSQPYVIVAPDGLGDGKPAAAYWTSNAPKQIARFIGPQRWDTATTFSIQDPASSTPSLVHACAWDSASGKLSVAIRDGMQTEDQGLFNLSARLTVKSTHSHDLTPPLVSVGGTTRAFYLPRPEPALPRVSESMQLGDNLFETLTYTAAFVDQAGYMAKFAIDRHKEIDALYHQELERATQLTKQLEEAQKALASVKSELDTVTQQNAALLKAHDELKAAISKY